MSTSDQPLTDWQSDKTVVQLRNDLQELLAPISSSRVPAPLDALDALDALCAAVAEASRGGADSARLDWLERASAKRNILLLGWGDGMHEQRRIYEPAEYDARTDEERERLRGQWRIVTNRMASVGSGLRAAIDAARAAEEGKT